MCGCSPNDRDLATTRAWAWRRSGAVWTSLCDALLCEVLAVNFEVKLRLAPVLLFIFSSSRLRCGGPSFRRKGAGDRS